MLNFLRLSPPNTKHFLHSLSRTACSIKEFPCANEYVWWMFYLADKKAKPTHADQKALPRSWILTLTPLDRRLRTHLNNMRQAHTLSLQHLGFSVSSQPNNDTHTFGLGFHDLLEYQRPFCGLIGVIMDGLVSKCSNCSANSSVWPQDAPFSRAAPDFPSPL